MKKLFFVLPHLFVSLAFADPGVILDAKGKVTINQGGKIVSAQTGTKFIDNAMIEVATGGSATLMFSNGVVKKLSSGEKFTAAKAAPGESGGSPLIKGIAMAYNDATKASKGPTVHGMVKAAPGQKATAPKGDPILSPERSKQMEADIKQINSLGLDKDGYALMQAQVYYKYSQNQKVVNTLLPIYKSQNPPTEMVKSLLALGYERLGRPDEAKKYR